MVPIPTTLLSTSLSAAKTCSCLRWLRNHKRELALFDSNLSLVLWPIKLFKKSYKDGDHELFRANFLSTFGVGRDDNLARVVCALVDPIISTFRIKNLFSVYVMGTKWTKRDVRELKSGRWVVHGKIS